MNLRKFPFQRNRQTWWRAAILLMSIAALHCGGEQAAEPGTPSEQLSLSPSNPQSAQGTAQQFRVRSLSEDGHLHELTQKVTWRVAVEGGSPLPMSADGLLELTEPGRYRVTAEYGNHTLATVLTVTTATLTSIAISPSAPKVAKGGSQSFTATAHFSDGTTQDVTALAAWSVKDVTGTGVAVINTLGVAKATNVGQARISVRYKTHTASTTLQVTAATLLALAVSPSNPTIGKGSSQPFAASGTFSDGSVQDVTADADWAVSDLMGRGVATVSGLGVVTGQAIGQATVSAAYQGQVVETTLTVTAATVVSLAISPTAATLAKGTTQTFVATATFSDGSRQVVTDVGTWTATDRSGLGVASVNSSGLATGNAVGTATIACTYRGGSVAATLQVSPAVLTGMGVQPAAATIAKGLTQSFALIGTYSDGSQQDLSWMAAWTAVDVAGTNVASVSAKGLALGKNVGKATVTAAYLGKSASSSLTVTAASVSELVVTPRGSMVSKGATQQFYTTGILSDGSTQDLTNLVSWTATDIAPASGVATINASGLATGLHGGQATILAQYLGLTTSTVLTVSAWVAQASGTTRELNGVWGSDPTNVWSVGELGTILKWNGSAWAAQASGTAQHLEGVWGSDKNNVWAVGELGTIVKWDGTSWAAQASGTTQNLSGVWGSDAHNVWTVGANGTILKWNGTAWAVQTSGTTEYLWSVRGSDVSNVWAAGQNGTIVKWNGTSWAAQTSGTTQNLSDVWVSDANNVWVLDGATDILQWNGTSWVAKSASTGVALVLDGLWGSDKNNVWAVSWLGRGGTSWVGTIQKWNGTSWVDEVSDNTNNLVAVGGIDKNNVWAVGSNGTILQRSP